MSAVIAPAPLPAGRGIPAAAWPQPPLRVRLVVLTLLTRVAALDARVHQHASNSSRPPSTDTPATKRQRRRPAPERRKPGGQPGPSGHPQGLWEPTATVVLFPTACAWGHRAFSTVTPSYPHQVLERPGMRRAVTHWLLPRGQCRAGSQPCTATMPLDQRSGDGPRVTGFVGELAGIVGASRSAVQDLCAAGFGLPLSTGAIQQLGDRGSEAMVPSDDALGTGARTASVTDLDETSWRMPGERHGLWGMAHPEVASFPLPPQRSHAAFSQLMATWAGSLGREGAVV